MKKILSMILTLCMVATSLCTFPVSTVQAAVSVGNPTYTVQTTVDGSDAFVYAYNVLDYGADKNGNNDCTDIFQSVLDKAGQIGGAIVYAPAGRYKITGSLSIPKGVTLRGDWTKPTAGQPLTSGTILMAYTGRNQGEDDTPFIEMVMEDGLMDLTIWYPEQDPNNITPYSPTIRLGRNNHFGNEYHNVKNVTLVNSYIGIRWNMKNGGASPVLNGIYGTPLKKGIEIDCIADVGRIDNVSFSPDYWSGSGFAGAPAKGSSFEDWIYNNGTGIVMRRNDWSYACYVDIDGYNVGYNTKYSNEGNGSTPNGHHYKFNLKNCKTGILFETSNYVGILFNEINMHNCETGIQMNGGTTDTIQFAKSKFACTKYAINVDKASTTKVLLYDSIITNGVVNMDGGTLMSTGCTYSNSAPQIVLGSVGRASLAANEFPNGKNILNNSIYKSELDNADITVPSVPDFPDSKAHYQSHMPDNLTLYVVTEAPYYANNSSNHGGGNDCTTAIQNALNDASRNGGGIVFLPSGHYRINGHLTIPSNVELRGATDLSTVPHGTGAILEAYENKGNPSGDPLIKISSNAGVRGIIVNYPEQTFQLSSDGQYHPVDYPATLQGAGSNVYVINTGIRAATYGLDLDTYRCDNHYVDWLTGHVNKICVKVGNGSSNGIISNLMFNTIVYACGQENPKFGGFPNSPNTPGGQSNAEVYNQQLRELEFLIIGDTNNQTLYNCFPYGAYIGTKIINEGNGGPQNLISMGLGIDGSRKAVYMTSGLTGKMDFIDNQIVSLNNDTPITRYFEVEPNSSMTTSFYNTDLWGFPEKAVVMGSNAGTLNLITANFQQRGYNGALTVDNGSRLNVINSSFNTNNATFSNGSNNIGMITTVADYTDSEKNAFAQNVANFPTGVEINADSQAMSNVNRDGWIATSNVNSNMTGQALDGDLNTQWNSSWQAPGQWFQVDMQSVQNFDTIVTTLGNTNDSPGQYVVKVSNDGYNWNEVASGSNNNIFSVGEQNARYVRIEQSSSAGKFWAVFEFYVLKSSTFVPNTEVIEPEEVEVPGSFDRTDVNGYIDFSGTNDKEEGIHLVRSTDANYDSYTEKITNGSENYISVGASGKYAYFKVDSNVVSSSDKNVTVGITYMDDTDAPILLEYNAVEGTQSTGLSNYDKVLQHGTNTGKWKTIEFELSNANFRKAQNNGADFRVTCLESGVKIKDVFVIKRAGDDSAPVTITSQPQSVTANDGDTATFTVVATGNVVSYQWQAKAPSGSWKNLASSVQGYNQATLYMGAIEARNGYQYRCVVKGENGNVVTDAVTLTVVSGVTITSQPQDVYIGVNGMAVFTVEVTGNVKSYQWQSKTPTGSWKNASSAVAGYNEAIMSIPAIKARDGYQFRCVVKDENGKNTITEVATLTINLDAALTITSQPKSVEVTAGTKASFSVAAKGEGLFYLWQYRTSSTAGWNYCASTTEGYNTATIKVDAAAANNGYQYRCVIANSDGAVLTSNAAKLTVK